MHPLPPVAPGGPPLSPREVAPYFEPSEISPEYAHLQPGLGRHLTRLKVPSLVWLLAWSSARHWRLVLVHCSGQVASLGGRACVPAVS